MLTTIELIRSGYRNLLNSRRSYASFVSSNYVLFEEINEWQKKLHVRDVTIIDPMSGYGGTANFCASIGIPSYCIEYNYPQYLWQLLLTNDARKITNLVIKDILSRDSIIEKNHSAESSGNLFTSAALAILLELYEHIHGSVESVAGKNKNDSREELALAILLPFVSRLSCYSSSDTSSHIKAGGICLYRGYSEDFKIYLVKLAECLNAAPLRAPGSFLVYDDARVHSSGGIRFHSMVTSPPYPNSRDFHSMFKIENTFIDKIMEYVKFPISMSSQGNIGSVFVKNKIISMPKSSVAQNFLRAAEEKASNKSERAKSDHRTYYGPYFTNYFSLLERAYENVSEMLCHPFFGYIIVVNNTYRGIQVPVAQVVSDIWQRLGYTATFRDEVERFHVGTKNPRAKGVRAKHVEYIIRIESL